MIERPSLGLEVDHLAAAHAEHTGGLGELLDERAAHRRIRMGRRCGQDLEGQALEGVAGEDRGRLVELAVAARPPAPGQRVVHRRQVVVDQRVAVDQLDRGADPEGSARGHREQIGAGRRRGRVAAACRRPARRSASPRAGAPGAPAMGGSRRSSSTSIASATVAIRCGQGGHRAGRAGSMGSVRDAAVRAEGDLLDPELRFLELALAMLLERRAALVRLDRGFEVELATLEVLHDPLELRERLLEAHPRNVGLRRLGGVRRLPRRHRDRATRSASSGILRSQVRQYRRLRAHATRSDAQGSFARARSDHSHLRAPRPPVLRRDGSASAISWRVTQS